MVFRAEARLLTGKSGTLTVPRQRHGVDVPDMADACPQPLASRPQCELDPVSPALARLQTPHPYGRAARRPRRSRVDAPRGHSYTRGIARAGDARGHLARRNALAIAQTITGAASYFVFLEHVSDASAAATDEDTFLHELARLLFTDLKRHRKAARPTGSPPRSKRTARASAARVHLTSTGSRVK